MAQTPAAISTTSDTAAQARVMGADDGACRARGSPRSVSGMAFGVRANQVTL